MPVARDLMVVSVAAFGLTFHEAAEQRAHISDRSARTTVGLEITLEFLAPPARHVDTTLGIQVKYFQELPKG